MGLRSKFRRWYRKRAFQRGTLITTLGPTDDVRGFIERFREKYVAVELIRVGGDKDGGYLLPDVLDQIDCCFSPGVDYVADFESELSERYGISSYMADASVAGPPSNDPNFHFIGKFLGSRTDGDVITLSDWVDETIGDSDVSPILQMDIEGGEYDVLTFETADRLAQFSIMIVEFHGLHKLFDKQFLRGVSSIFEKIYHHFSIAHVHPNNCNAIVGLDGVEVPPVIEVTFIRNDLVDSFASTNGISLPHALDRMNNPDGEDIVMPESWWRKN
ncbi:MAG: FkbM family methyltransferase [Pseudomonadota bacterium]